MTAVPRLALPRQCCTMPEAGDPTSAPGDSSAQGAQGRVAGRAPREQTRSCGHPESRGAGQLWSRALAIPNLNGWCPTP